VAAGVSISEAFDVLGFPPDSSRALVGVDEVALVVPLVGAVRAWAAVRLGSVVACGCQDELVDDDEAAVEVLATGSGTRCLRLGSGVPSASAGLVETDSWWSFTLLRTAFAGGGCAASCSPFDPVAELAFELCAASIANNFLFVVCTAAQSAF
jgi:hypothetical protein